MILAYRQNLKKLNYSEKNILTDVCHISKNLYNDALYNVRQHFFNTGKLLDYSENEILLKDNCNYKKLGNEVALEVIKNVGYMFKSFIAMQEYKKKGRKFAEGSKIPGYAPKDGMKSVIISWTHIRDNVLYIHFKMISDIIIKIALPKQLVGKKIVFARIIPKHYGRHIFIEFLYLQDAYKRKLDYSKGMGIDLGISNLTTCATSTGESFIVDGKKLKSINHWYNKENARLQSIKDKQKFPGKFTKRQYENVNKRSNRVYDYLSKTARYIVDFCISHEIGNVVCGYSYGMKSDIVVSDKMNKTNKQSFTGIPFTLLIKKLKYLCAINGIKFIIQEESYTSKASFLDKDYIPMYEDLRRNYKFSGKRVNRGMYLSKNGTKINADLNGALNILRKSRVVCLDALYCKGVLGTPKRIRIN